jgi:hypothetical protein
MGHISLWSTVTDNLLGQNINIKIKTQKLNYTSKEDSLEVNTKKTKHMFISCHRKYRTE